MPGREGWGNSGGRRAEGLGDLGFDEEAEVRASPKYKSGALPLSGDRAVGRVEVDEEVRASPTDMSGALPRSGDKAIGRVVVVGEVRASPTDRSGALPLSENWAVGCDNGPP